MSKVCAIIASCEACSGIPKTEMDKAISALKEDKNIGAVLSVKPPCMREAKKEHKALQITGCDRAVVVTWCSQERIGGAIALPKAISSSLIEMIDLSIYTSKDEKDKTSVDVLARVIRENAARLILAEPLKDRRLPYVSKVVAVIGSSDQAIKAAKALASNRIAARLITSQSILETKAEHLEMICEALPEALSGIPGNFKIAYKKNGERKETDAAAILLVSERCLSNIRPPANPRVSFVPLEQFENYSKRGGKVKGIAFLDDLYSLTTAADPNVPAWHTLLESAKTAAANKLADCVTVIARDVKAVGLLELAWKEAAEAGVKFIRYDDKTRPKIEKTEPVISVKDLVLGESLQIPADVIVAPVTTKPWEPPFIEKLFIPSDWDFRVRSRGPQRGLAQSSCDGIFLAGYASFAKLTDQAYPDLGSVVSQIVSFMHRGYHVAKGAVADINEGKCSACFTCVRTCPYRAAKMNESWKAEIIADKCAGCGNCVAVCPSKAIELKNCTRPQLQSQVNASLEVML